MKTYTFHVSLPGFGRLWRKIEMEAGQTLEDLHDAIQDAFDFDRDHLYSFFMSGRAWDDSTEHSLPEGVDPYGFGLDAFDEEQEGEDQAQEAWTPPVEITPEGAYPRIVQSVGEAPEQYGVWDDEEADGGEMTADAQD
jgi:hypothetical protein